MKLSRAIMGMPITVEALGPDVTAAVLEEVMAYFVWVDGLFSTYKPESEISRINRGELTPDGTSSEARAVLAECERLNELSQGYFAIERDGRIDPSGYVKGWAIYNAAQLLELRGVRRYLVDAGGDLQLRGPGPNGGAWAVGIRHPWEPSKQAKVLYVHEGAVATSGLYERGHHIYNPHTGEAVTDPVSFTVVGPSIERADAFATAAFGMGRDGLMWVKRQGYEAMMINRDGTMTMTEGFRRYERG